MRKISSLPSPGRVLLLALLAVALFGLGSAATFIALGIRADRTRLAAVEEKDASELLMDFSHRFERVALADPFLLPTEAAGNAADLYWPEGAEPAAGCDTPFTPRLFDFTAMMFEKRPDAMREAIRCPRIDDMVRAASLPDMVVGDRFAAGDPDFDFFGSSEQLREPQKALGALLARAHLRIQAREWAGAERDARAVVSAGRQFLWDSPHPQGFSMGLMLMVGGLDHLRVLYERRGDRAFAAMALAARDSLGALQRGVSSVLDVVHGTSTFPGLLRYTVAAAENDGLPLGVRSELVIMLGYGHVGHTAERWLGPSRSRERALARLERDADLMPAIAQARKGLDLSMRERIDLATQWNL